MIASFRGELRKYFSTRLWWILLLIMVAYVALTAGAMAFVLTADMPGSDASLFGVDPAELAGSLYALGPSVAYVLPALIGALAVTSEFRYQTITPTLLADPSRTRFLAGKLLGAIPIGLAFGLASTAASVAASAPVLAASDYPTGLGTSGIWLVLVQATAAMALWTLVGVGFGAILKNQVAAIVVLLAFTQLVEPIARIALASWEPTQGIAKFLPGQAGDALAGGSLYSIAGTGIDGAMLLPWQGGLVLVGYALVFCLIGRLTTLRADIA